MIPVNNMGALEKEFEDDEGRTRRGYKCSQGYWSIGIGHNTEGKDLSDRAIRVIFEDDLQDAVADLDRIYPGWRDLSERRKRALINMSFQLGGSRLAAFKKMWAAIKVGDFVTAAAEAKDSLWFKQTQESRTERVIRYLKEG